MDFLKKYRVTIEPCEEGGFFAECPDLPGCHIQAETYLAAVREIHAVIEDYVADLIESNARVLRSDHQLAV